MKNLSLWCPVDRWKISQLFGQNLSPIYKQMGMIGHNGIDIVTYHGQPVRASHNGIVKNVSNDEKSGVGIELQTEEKYEYQGQEGYYKTIYWHFVHNSISLKVGDRVIAGDIIGQADNTGWSTGDHLHFGLKLLDGNFNTTNWGNGYFGAVDPAPVMSGFFAKDRMTVLDLYDQLLNVIKQMMFYVSK